VGRGAGGGTIDWFVDKETNRNSVQIIIEITADEDRPMEIGRVTSDSSAASAAAVRRGIDAGWRDGCSGTRRGDGRGRLASIPRQHTIDSQTMQSETTGSENSFGISNSGTRHRIEYFQRSACDSCSVRSVFVAGYALRGVL